MAVDLNTLKVLKLNGTETFRLLYSSMNIDSSKFKITIPCELADVESTVSKFDNITSLEIYDAEGALIKKLPNYTGHGNIEIPKKELYRTASGDCIQALTIWLQDIDLRSTVKKLNEKIDPVVNFDDMDIDEYRQYYITQFNKKCSENIYAGVDVTTSYGVEHFDATDEDQRNIANLANVAMNVGCSMPYHKNSTQCKIYTPQDIITIYAEMQKLILRETTYCNALNTYARRLVVKSDISNLSYGQTLPDDITDFMNTSIEQGLAGIEAMIQKFAQVTSTTEE